MSNEAIYDFSYDDLVKKLNEMLTNEVLDTFVDIEFTKEDILKTIDDFDMYAEENETILRCCKRYLELAMFKRLCDNYYERLLNVDTDSFIKPYKDEEMLARFKGAIDNSDILGMLEISRLNNVLPTIYPNNSIVMYKINIEQTKVFLAYCKNNLDTLVKALQVFDDGTGDTRADIDGNGTVDKKSLESENTAKPLSEHPDLVEKFSKTAAEYKALVRFSKQETEKFIAKYPDDPDAIVMTPIEGTSVEDFFECARYYNQKNKHIIAKYGNRYMRVNRYSSKEQMIEHYNNKK